MPSDNRIPRELDTRESSKRAESWTPARRLPDPNPDPSFDYRYVRVMIQGEHDNLNLSQARRDGWEPVNASEHPELQVVSDFGTEKRFPDAVLVGGMLLCRRPKAIGAAIQKKADEENSTRARSVAASYLGENDRRMEKFVNIETRVSKFG